MYFGRIPCFFKLLPKMSFVLPQQVKWSSFLLLLLVLFLKLPFPATGGTCQLHCDTYRPSRYEAYTLNCNNLGTANLAACTSVCSSCDASVCDPKTPNIFNCPAIDLARCEKHCDANRPSGSTSAYTLDCVKKYQSKDEVDKCNSECIYCPILICDTEIPNIFDCPSSVKVPPPISERCKEHCDAERNDEHPFTLDCYFFNDFIECIDNCTHCIKDVCNQYDPALFNCPKGPTICQLLCDRNRPKGSISAYTYTCNETLSFCENVCGQCSGICDLKDPYKFKCPAKGVPITTPITTTPPTTTPHKTTPHSTTPHTTTPRTTTRRTTTHQPTYQGPCEDRCNARRPKGTHGAYRLKCKDYTTKEEVEKCKNMCKTCPSKICHPNRPDVYNCPAIQVTTIEPPKPFTSGPSQVVNSEDPGSSTLLFAAIALGIVFLLLVVGVAIFFIIRKNKGKKHVAPRTEDAGKPIWGEFELHDELSPPDISETSSSSISTAKSLSSFKSTSTVASAFTPKSAPAPKSRPTRMSVSTVMSAPTPKSKLKRKK